MFNFIWVELLKKPIFNSLLVLDYAIGDLGIAIIVLTIILKTLLIPLTLPQLKMSTKRNDLSDELKKLKEKYKDDKSKLAKKQMELYKKHGVNPAAGCLPMVAFSVVLFALFRVFISLFEGTIPDSYFYFEFLKDLSIDNTFLYLNLFEPDPFYILPVLTGIAQFFSSKLMMPKVDKAQKIADETDTDMDNMAVQMQSQMVYILPFITVFFTSRFPAGLTLYWFISSLYSALQNIIVRRYMGKGE